MCNRQHFLSVFATIVLLFTFSGAVYAQSAKPHKEIVDGKFYKVKVQGDSRRFSVSTGKGHSVKHGLHVTYGGPTSFFSVRVYDGSTLFTDYVQGSPRQKAHDRKKIDKHTSLELKSTERKDDGFRIVFQTPDKAKHRLEIIQDVRLSGHSLNSASVRVSLRISNNGDKAVKLAVRNLWDYEIDRDDGPAFITSDGKEYVDERNFIKPTATHFHVQGNEKQKGKKVLRVRGTVNLSELGPFQHSPTRLVHACYQTARLTAFDYTVRENNRIIASKNDRSCDTRGAGGDNAVLLYFGHDYATSTEIPSDVTKVFTAFVAKEEVPTVPISAMKDSDGDAIPDVWETKGVDLDLDGTAEYALDGADKDTKNIYVYYDWIGDNKPSEAALKSVVKAFADAPVDKVGNAYRGIKLKFKEGRKVEKLFGKDTDDELGKTVGDFYSWEEFSNIKAENFPEKYWPTHRYMILGTKMGGMGNSGMARGVPSSDFIVTVGTFEKDPDRKKRLVANTIMHELGHTLGLAHGGLGDWSEVNFNRKPNYLSVMNYSFQMAGIPMKNSSQTKLDYSRFGKSTIATLSENKLNESSGLKKSGKTPAGGGSYMTTIYCKKPAPAPSTATAAAATAGSISKTIDGASYALEDVDAFSGIDWNCDGKIAAAAKTVSADVNPSAGETGKLSTLTPDNDWNRLTFRAGAIGQLGAALNLPLFTDPNEYPEPTKEDYEAFKRREFILDRPDWGLFKNGGFEILRAGVKRQGQFKVKIGEPVLDAWRVHGTINKDHKPFRGIEVRKAAAEGQRQAGNQVRLLGEQVAVYQRVKTVPGRQYNLSLDISGPVDTSFFVITGSEYHGPYSPGQGVSSNTGKEISLSFTAKRASTYIQLHNGHTATSPWLDNVRLKEDVDLFADR